jgi:hypothetical protein
MEITKKAGLTVTFQAKRTGASFEHVSTCIQIGTNITLESCALIRLKRFQTL